MARRIIFPFTFLLLIAVLFFLPFFIAGTIPYAGDFTGSDLTELNLPFRYLAAESFKNGQAPLWTDKLSAGFPMLAEGQAGIFYPFNLVLFSLLPFFWAVNIGFLLNFFLGGLFTFLYCRLLKISQFGSILSALAFSFSGFFIFRIKHLNHINAAIWLMLVFYLVEKYFKSRRKILVLISLSLVLAVQFFAGSPPFSYISLISAIIYFVVKYFIEYKTIGFRDIVPKLILPWVLVGVISFGLAAVQLLPTLFNAASSGRSLTMTYGDIVVQPYTPASLLYFISPYFLGNPSLNTYPVQQNIFGIFWENNIYFGILPFVLAIMAVIFLFARNKNVRLLTILLLVSFLFVFGDLSPVFNIFWSLIPGFQMFRFPQRFLLTALVSLTVLAGFGFDFIWQKVLSWQEKSRQLARSKMLIKVLLPLAVILAVAIDLFVVSFKYLGALNYEKYFLPPQSVEFLNQDSDQFRVYSVNWPGAWHSIKQLMGGWQNNMSLFISGRELLMPNLNVFWDIPSAQDRASLEGGMLPKEMQELNSKLIIDSWIDEDGNGEYEISDRAVNVFSIQNVKYVLSYRNLINDNLTLVKEINKDFLPSLKIYQNELFLPNLNAFFKTKIAENLDDSIGLVFSDEFNPAKEVVLTSQDAKELDGLDGQASVNILDYRPGYLAAEVDFTNEGYLFFSQTFTSDWQAVIDGEKSEIFRANHAFMALKVPDGEHEVKFIYKPLSFAIGKWVSLFSLLGLVIFLFGYIVFNRKDFRLKTKD
ncbi:YfhO family protein [Candidatus Falkowbacteria bacterium]|nr:YfhO family protein [Candidatus Falkowbacteria bacterium]